MSRFECDVTRSRERLRVSLRRLGNLVSSIQEEYISEGIAKFASKREKIEHEAFTRFGHPETRSQERRRVSRRRFGKVVSNTFGEYILKDLICQLLVLEKIDFEGLCAKSASPFRKLCCGKQPRCRLFVSSKGLRKASSKGANGCVALKFGCFEHEVSITSSQFISQGN